jgi:hypothetical protein
LRGAAGVPCAPWTPHETSRVWRPSRPLKTK